jgi:hypothetical protein
MSGIEDASLDVTTDPFRIDGIPVALLWPIEAALAMPALRRIHRRLQNPNNAIKIFCEVAAS